MHHLSTEDVPRWLPALTSWAVERAARALPGTRATARRAPTLTSARPQTEGATGKPRARTRPVVGRAARAPRDTRARERLGAFGRARAPRTTAGAIRLRSVRTMGPAGRRAARVPRAAGTRATATPDASTSTGARATRVTPGSCARTLPRRVRGTRADRVLKASLETAQPARCAAWACTSRRPPW